VSYSSLSCFSVKPASPAETFSLGLRGSTTVPLNLYVAADVADAPAVMAIAATVMCSKVPQRRKVPGFGTRTVTAAVRAVPVAPPRTPKATAVFLRIEIVFSFLSFGPWTRNWTPTCFVPSRWIREIGPWHRPNARRSPLCKQSKHLSLVLIHYHSVSGFVPILDIASTYLDWVLITEPVIENHGSGRILELKDFIMLRVLESSTFNFQVTAAGVFSI
jgi:hypothetical protein